MCLVGLYTYCRMMHGAYNVKLIMTCFRCDMDEKNLGDIMLLCQLINNNPIHTNTITTPKQYALLLLFSYVMFGYFHSSIVRYSFCLCSTCILYLMMYERNDRNNNKKRMLCLCRLDLLWQELGYNIYIYISRFQLHLLLK